MRCPATPSSVSSASSVVAALSTGLPLTVTEGAGSRSLLAAAAEDAEQLLQRIVEAVDHALLQRDDAVVGDVNALGADLGAALGDVAVPDAKVFLERLEPVAGVERVHLHLRDVDEEARADELVVHVVLAQHVANVLA